MENVVTYFKKVETTGTTKDEAIKKSGLNLRVDATQAYKKWAKENATNEDDVKEWMKDYLRKKKLTMPKDGAYIVLQSAVADTRERPYKVEKPKYEARTHTPEKFYVLRDDAGNEIARYKTSKEADQKAKGYTTNFKESVNVVTEWKAKENNALYERVVYTPSKNSKIAKLLCFGYYELGE